MYLRQVCFMRKMTRIFCRYIFCVGIIVLGGCDSPVLYTVEGHNFCLPRRDLDTRGPFSLARFWTKVVTRGATMADSFSFRIQMPLDRSGQTRDAKGGNEGTGGAYSLFGVVEGAHRAGGFVAPIRGWYGDVLFSSDTEHERLPELIDGRDYFISHNARIFRWIYLVWTPSAKGKGSPITPSKDDDIFAACRRYSDDEPTYCHHGFEDGDVTVFYRIPIERLSSIPTFDAVISARLKEWRC